MSAFTHRFRRGTPRPEGLLAAVVLTALLSACAGEAPIKRYDGVAASNAAAVGVSTPLSVLRALAPAAGASCAAHDPTPQELAKQRSRIDPLRVPALYGDLFYGHRSDPLAAIDVDGARYRPYKEIDDPDTGCKAM
jgi:hypothetical protein